MGHSPKNPKLVPLDSPLEGEGEIVPDIAPVPVESFLSNMRMKKIVKTLLNARDSRSSAHPFLRYDEFMQKLLNAWNARDAELFVEILKEFLDQVALGIPHGGNLYEIPTLITFVQNCIAHPSCGFVPVAQRILSVINAPSQ